MATQYGVWKLLWKAGLGDMKESVNLPDLGKELVAVNMCTTAWKDVLSQIL